MLILLPDTNFFLQYRNPAELPWADIGAGDEVVIKVCRAVLREIDNFKADGNARRARRARDLSSRFRQMVKDRQPAVLRAVNPKVVLSFAPRSPAGYVAPAALDMNKPDDRVIGDVLAAVQALGGEGYLLTDDINMMLSAEDLQLACIATPEVWRLPPEKDKRDKQLNELKVQVARLSRSAPQLSVSVSSDGQPVTEPLMIRKVEYTPLPPDVVEELATGLEKRYPLKTDFSREADDRIAMADVMKIANQQTVAGLLASHLVGHLGSDEWRPPSESSIEDYRDAHAKWLGDIRRFLAELHTALPSRSGQVPLSFSLENSGAVPADHVLIDIEALGGFLLERRPKKDAAKEPTLALPSVPDAPGWKTVITGRYGSALQALQGTMGGANPFAYEGPGHFVPPFYPEAPHVEDPQSFYWRDGPPSRRMPAWGYRCGELRHQAQAKLFTAIVVAPAEDGVTRGAVRFRASARNLPDPIERTVAVRVEVEAGDTEAAARAMLPKPLLKLRFKGRNAGS